MPLTKPREPLSICFIHDDRAGHQRQLEALEQQLLTLTNCTTHWLDVAEPRKRQQDTFRCDICIGAGHRTHWPLWKLSRQHKAFSAVLMSPSLPDWMFDAIICPRHDGKTQNERTLITEGPINTVQAPLPSNDESDPVALHNLILLGGPSKHFHWDTELLSRDIALLLERYPNLPWYLLPSRRTPESTITSMQKMRGDIKVLDRNADLNTLLRQSKQVWVSADSSNMLYESLTAGKATGVLELKARTKLLRTNRLNSELQRLFGQGHVMRLSQALDEEAIKNWPQRPLNEANRAALWLLKRFQAFRNRQGGGNV